MISPKGISKKKKFFVSYINISYNSEHYEVEKVIGKRSEPHEQYLVRWKGYGSEHDSWCDVDDLRCARLVKR